jgi:hypothetical protein
LVVCVPNRAPIGVEQQVPVCVGNSGAAFVGTQLPVQQYRGWRGVEANASLVPKIPIVGLALGKGKKGKQEEKEAKAVHYRAKLMIFEAMAYHSKLFAPIKD